MQQVELYSLVIRQCWSTGVLLLSQTLESHRTQHAVKRAVRLTARPELKHKAVQLKSMENP